MTGVAGTGTGNGTGDGTGTRVEILDRELLAATGDALVAAVAESVPSRLMKQDPTLWGPGAEPEASKRLGWVHLYSSSRALLPRLAELRERLEAAGLDHVVLAGMGGSSLAPEVITRTAGVPLTVLDTTDPHQVRRALGERLESTVVVVSSKSGGTVETDSHRRAYEQAFRDAGLSEAEIAQRFVIVTDPSSPLEAAARQAGYEVVLADPDVGGRYSALTAFGLVPSALAGVDVTELLDAAAAEAPSLSRESDNPGLTLGAAMGGGALAGRDKLVIADAGSGIVGFGDWAEQLVAESTGKDGRGVLPVVVEGMDSPGFADAGPDAQRVVLGGAGAVPDALPAELEHTGVSGPLGGQFLVWEYATAVAGQILGINPFDQPNVAETKDNTKALLEEYGDGPLPEGEPVLVDGAVAVYGDAELLGGASDLAGTLTALLNCVESFASPPAPQAPRASLTDVESFASPPAPQAPRASLTDVGEGGYLAVMAYLDRVGDADAAWVRPLLAQRLAARQVTFGWGPRFLHSTGQYHKGGPPKGVFLQVTGAVTEDLPVPGRPYTFGRLQLAQALGDLRALTQRQRPAVRLHLLDRRAGVRQLLAAAEGSP